MDRLTILSPTGETLFDARRADGFAGATAALEAAQNAPVSVMEGARWFGELRAITDFARRSRELAPPLTEVLVELHQLALTDVLPSMPVPRQSSFAVEQENRLTAEILSLRRELPAVPSVAAPVEPSGPVVLPAPSTGWSFAVTRVVGYSRPLSVDDDLEADAAALRAAGRHSCPSRAGRPQGSRAAILAGRAFRWGCAPRVAGGPAVAVANSLHLYRCGDGWSRRGLPVDRRAGALGWLTADNGRGVHGAGVNASRADQRPDPRAGWRLRRPRAASSADRRS